MPLIKDDTLQFEPGSRWSYSNTGMLVLGKVIEAASGQDYFTYVREHVAKPAGMTSTDAYERAVLQALPSHATEHIPVYERVLGIAPGGDQNEEDRRQVVVAAWVGQLAATMTSVETALQAISPQLSLDELPEDESVVAMFGRMFPAYGDEADGVPQYPNYSSEFVLRAVYTLASGETTIPSLIRLAVKRLLNAVLPAWVDWGLYQDTSPSTGLICDGGSVGSVLDYTPLGS